MQRALTLHPQVSCPSESDCRSLYEGLSWVFGEFNKVLQLYDRRTGGQGAALVGGESVNAIFRSALETMMREAGKGKTIIGANDNNIIANLEFFNDLFDQPKLIAIFRNPVDQGLSAWHHNLRLAREENDPRHSQLVTQFGDLVGWLRQSAQIFIQNVERWRAFSAGRDNVYMVRYEDLIAERKETMRGVFSFLGADTNSAILDGIVSETDIGRMRSKSSNPGFFRAGSIDMGIGEITQQLQSELYEMVSDAMERVGYTADLDLPLKV
ncbi:MAG: sulfotransferase [Gammaproteobacteria bacterium]|nr:sulfotransferase [Gammaproteobacteria bacterium]